MASRARSKVAAVLTALVVAGLVRAESPPTPYDAALKTAGIDEKALHQDAGRWRGGGARSLRTFEDAWEDPARLEAIVRSADGALRVAAPLGTAALIEAAAGYAIEASATRTTPPRLEVAPAANLAAAIALVSSRAGDPLSPERLAELARRIEAVPAPVCSRAAIVLAAVPAALDGLAAALDGFKPAGLDDDARRALAYRTAIGFGRSHKVDETTRELLRTFDRDALHAGALILARAVDQASERLPRDVGAFSFAWDTPIGRIELSGDANDSHDRGPYLYVHDTGGDDLYRPAGSKEQWRFPIAVAIDHQGDDRYEGDELYFGTGITGIGFLVDIRGDDVTRATDVGPGSGIFGVGVALDRQGDDRSTVHVFGQGAGTCGLGLHADLDGNDVYRCLAKAQGYGGTLGTGVLVDLRGDDRYEANDSEISHPSAQTADHNVSLAQGFGFGWRLHPGDDQSIAGGIGLLLDAGGDDRYRCGVFGQGAGYWYALGGLVDGGGDDVYEGIWYVQGAAAHFATGCLIDRAGNDRHVGPTQALGHGHDASTGLFVDESGDDRYTGGGMSLGAGHWHGIGLFRDEGGRDWFDGGGECFGYARGTEEGRHALGAFVAKGELTFRQGRPGDVALIGSGVYGVRSLKP